MVAALQGGTNDTSLELFGGESIFGRQQYL